MFGTYKRLGVHVSSSNMEVIRAARMRIAEEHRTGQEKKEQRKAFYRRMLDYHRRAKVVYSLIEGC